MSDTRAAMREFRFLEDKRQAEGLTPAEEQRWAELRQALGADAFQPPYPAQVPGYYAADGQWYPYAPGYFPPPPTYQPGYPAPPGYATYPVDAYGNPMPYGAYDPNYAQPQGANFPDPANPTPEPVEQPGDPQAQDPNYEGQNYSDPAQANYPDPNGYPAYPAPLYPPPAQYYPYDPAQGSYNSGESPVPAQQPPLSEGPEFEGGADVPASPGAENLNAPTAFAPDGPIEIDPNEVVEVDVAAPPAEAPLAESSPTIRVAAPPELLALSQENPLLQADPALEFADAPVVSDDISVPSPTPFQVGATAAPVIGGPSPFPSTLSAPGIGGATPERQPPFETTLPDLRIQLLDEPETKLEPAAPSAPEMQFSPSPEPLPDLGPEPEVGFDTAVEPLPEIFAEPENVDPAPSQSADSAASRPAEELFGNPAADPDPLALPPQSGADSLQLASAAEFVQDAVAASSDPALHQQRGIEWSPQGDNASEPMEIVRPEDEQAEDTAAANFEEFEIASAAEFLNDAAAVNSAPQFTEALPIPATAAQVEPPEARLERPRTSPEEPSAPAKVGMAVARNAPTVGAPLQSPAPGNPPVEFEPVWQSPQKPAAPVATAIPPSGASSNGSTPLARIATRSVPASEVAVTPPKAPAASSPVPAASAIPPPRPSVSTFVQGEHRVILHTVEGQVKRGMLRDMDFRDEIVTLEQQNGAPAERIPAARLKAVFFMLPLGAPQAQPKGQKIRVTFNDGRQVAGYAEDFNGTNAGFFLVPADTRTNTNKIYIYRSSVQSITAG